MADHTPGPWRADNDWTEGDFWCVFAGNKEIANLGEYEWSWLGDCSDSEPEPFEPESAAANARLIAAAPDLLVALKSCVSWMPNCPARTEARAVLDTQNKETK